MAAVIRRNSSTASFGSLMTFDLMGDLSQKSDVSNHSFLPFVKPDASASFLKDSAFYDFSSGLEMELPEFESAGAMMGPPGLDLDYFNTEPAELPVQQQQQYLLQKTADLSRQSSTDDSFFAAMQAASAHQRELQDAQFLKQEPFEFLAAAAPDADADSSYNAHSRTVSPSSSHEEDFYPAAAAPKSRRATSARSSKKRSRSWSNTSAAPAARAPRRAAAAAAAIKFEAVAAPAASASEEEPEEEEEEEEIDESLSADQRELRHKRARNRLHAKKSRRRKVVAMDALEAQLLQLRAENLGLRQLVRTALPDRAEAILIECCGGESGAITPAGGCVPVASNSSSSSSRAHRLDRHSPSVKPEATLQQQQGVRGKSLMSRAHPAAAASGGGGGAGPVDKTSGHFYKPCAKELRAGVPNALQLMEQDFQMISSLKTSQQNFVLTNPSLPGDPVVYASAGFLAHSGYTAAEIIGKNMRIMQGPGTDQSSIDIIRRNLAAGRETSLCLLNYRADKTPFWNQLYIGALRDREGRVVNHIGIQTEVPTLPAIEFHRRLHKVPLPEDLMHEEGERAAAAAAASAAGNSSSSRHSSRHSSSGSHQQQQSSVFAAAGRAAAGHYSKARTGAPAPPVSWAAASAAVYNSANSMSDEGEGASDSEAGFKQYTSVTGSPSKALVVDPLRRTRASVH